MRTNFFTKRYHPPGTAPGTLKEVELKKIIPPQIHLVNFSASHFSEVTDADIGNCVNYLEQPETTWIHIQGSPNPEILSSLGKILGLHSLALEDILNTGQRPKFEMYGEQVFLVTSLPVLDEGEVHFEQISLFLGNNFLVSFHASEINPFQSILQRLQKNNEPIRKRKADYLLYCILDIVIDKGFPVLEHFGELLEKFEEKLLENPAKTTVSELHFIKRELLLLRRMLWPQREMVNSILRDQPQCISEDTRIYLRDCYDHIIQIMDLLETYRDISADMLDIFLSSNSHKLNENMRVLTVIATIFIPPTFITGLYGMNFDRGAGPFNMPELGWPYGYIFALTMIMVMIVGMLFFFKKKQWF